MYSCWSGRISGYPPESHYRMIALSCRCHREFFGYGNQIHVLDHRRQSVKVLFSTRWGVMHNPRDLTLSRTFQRSGKSTTCWKKVSMASIRRVNIAPNSASDLPFVRSKSMKDPQGPRDALSNISKSNISFEVPPLNQFHFNCPIASEVGMMKVAAAIFESTVTDVKAFGHFGSRSLSR